MCGIVGIYNLQNSLQLAINILENQSSRGKDATGIAYIKDNKIITKKEAIEPKIFKEKYLKYFKKLSEINICIGHNRQASVNIQNKHKDSEAHPFISEDKRFALVHNGTFIHYEYLSHLIDNLGHKRESGVDSEVFVHLLEEILKKYDRDEAIIKFHPLSEGNILILFDDGTLYGIPSHAFVLIQIDNGYIIASGLEYLVNILPEFSKDKEIKCFIPEEDTTLVKLYLENNTVKCVLYGNWEEHIVGYNDWIGIVKRTCDYCDTSQVLCQRIEHNKTIYYRCLSCYKNNKDIPLKKTTRIDEYTYYPYRRYNYLYGEPFMEFGEFTETIKDERGQCQECFVFKPLRELILCTKCNRHYCLGDIATHECMEEQK